MYKLKNTYINRMIALQLSSKEIDFILYIANFQNENGIVSSVYYKDVCAAINISIQKFYDIIAVLTGKMLISTEKINRADICVKLLGNEFMNHDFSDGYLNVSALDFQNKKFRELKAGSKLLYLYMQRFSQGKHMLVQRFYDSFSQLFYKTKKSIQIYLSELKKNHLLFVKKKRNRAYNYEMTIRKGNALQIRRVNIPFEKDGYLDNIKELIIRNFKRFLPTGSKEKVLYDIVHLADTKRAKGYSNFPIIIANAIRKSLELQKEEKKEQPVINAALVNKCLSGLLG